MTGSQPPDAPEGRRSGSGLYVSAGSGELEFERVAFFSDAVFAIAVTLPIINIHVPVSVGTGTALARFGRSSSTCSSSPSSPSCPMPPPWSATGGTTAPGTAFYAASIAAVGLTQGALWFHARRPG